MSFIHYTIVGHFNPEKVIPNERLRALRQLDEQTVRAALGELPREVQECVGFEDGYMVVQWAPLGLGNSEVAYDFAYRVAAQQQCLALESPAYLVTFPESARESQRKAWDALLASQPVKERPTVNANRLPAFTAPAPIPCPYCGKPLRTGLAK